MQKLSYLLTIILVVGIIGCGDDSTGPDIGEPPATPDLEQAQPDVSFFQDNNPQKTSTSSEIVTTTNYTQAQSIVLWNSIMFSFGQSYGSLFSQVDQEEASYDDGVWEWSYNYNYGGISADYRTTAEELSNAIRWATYWSFDDGQGNGFEDYKILEGTISNDGSTGDWTFNAMDPDLEQEVPFLTSTWTISSETEKEITLEMFGDSIDDETADKTATISFGQNGADFTMDFEFADGDDYLVTWNTDTNIGSITYDGEQLCWDEEFQDVPCE